MMNAYQPLVELTRGPLVESIHFGALRIGILDEHNGEIVG